MLFNCISKHCMVPHRSIVGTKKIKKRESSISCNTNVEIADHYKIDDDFHHLFRYDSHRLYHLYWTKHAISNVFFRKKLKLYHLNPLKYFMIMIKQVWHSMYVCVCVYNQQDKLA